MTRPERGPVNLKNHFTISDPDGQGLVEAGGDQPAWTDQLHGAASRTAASPRSTPAAKRTVPVSSLHCRKISAPSGTSRARCRCGTRAGGRTIGYDSAEKYPHSHDTIAYGAPSLIALASGELLATWWCTGASLVHARWARLAVG